MTLLKKVFKTIICFFLLLPLSLAAQEKTSLPEGFAITVEGIFYKGTPLLFEVPVQEWEKVLGPARQTGEYNHAKSYTWDNLGVTVRTLGHDDSQEDSPVKVREFYIYFRNLDWTYARTGDWTRYIYTDGYYNIRPQDWNEGKPLTKQQLQDIKYLNTRPGKKKKSDFDIPYQIHNETVSLQGAAIDSTTTMAEINRRLQEKGAKPFHFSAALGGAGSSANGDETGGYSGHYYTGLGNNKKWYQLDSVNWRGEVVYVKVRQLSPDEMDIMNGKH